MAMRVLTLDKLQEFISNHTGVEHSMISNDDYVSFVNKDKNTISYSLSSKRLSGKDTKYLRFRDDVSGLIKIDNKIIDDESLKPYTYLLD